MQPLNTFRTDLIRRYIINGYSIFNTQTREKKCKTVWGKYEKYKPTKEEIFKWIRSPIQNWAIVCGQISNLVVFDVDTKNGGDPTPFLNQNLYTVRTPSGGYHFYTLYDPLFEKTVHKKENEGLLKAVDIQSNGAIVFCPPSEFANGKYKIENDVPVCHLPPDLKARILENLEIEKESPEFTPFTPKKDFLSQKPGDIFNALASWDEVLIPLGWKKVYTTANAITYWTRPGKDYGVSASTNWKGYDLFFPYTKSVNELIPMKGYTKFSLLVALKYNGDYRACAKDLVIENYKKANKLL